MTMTELHLKCLVPVSDNSGFTIYNLPYGIFKAKNKKASVGVAIGDIVLDMAALYERGIFSACLDKNIFATDSLNDFMAMEKSVHKAVRSNLQAWVTGDIPGWHIAQAGIDWWPMHAVDMLMPFRVAGYTDFYSGMYHAENVGKMFRPSSPPLLANWKHMPVAYHGRSSSVIVSGTPVHRPVGQYLNENGHVVFGPTQKLDYEIELAYVIGKPSALGSSVSVEEAPEHIFGCVLLNDISARDIQRWEYQPLGPFLGKNFATAISPWVVTMEALQPFMVKGCEQDVPVLPYLKDDHKFIPDIHLEMQIVTSSGEKATTGKVRSSEVYWSITQQIAHHTVNGCNLETGDILATGTISGKEEISWGSLLERTFDGKQSISIGAHERAYLENGDTMIFSGIAENGVLRVGFGEVVTNILPAKKQ